jgi:hypothetical protein
MMKRYVGSFILFSDTCAISDACMYNSNQCFRTSHTRTYKHGFEASMVQRCCWYSQLRQ